MRSFIYLDTDTVNSYIAQIDDGLTTLQTKTTQKSKENQKQSSHTADAAGKADFTIFKKGVEAKIDYIYNHISSTTKSKLYSDVETKVLHDNAFKQVMEYLRNEDLFKSDEPKIGDFIDVEGSLRLLDLEYYKNLFNEDDFIKLINDPQKEIIEDEYKRRIEEKEQSLNRETKRSPDYKRAIGEIEKEKKAAIVKIEDNTLELRKQLELLLKLFPYRILLSVDNNLAVIDEKFLRDDIKKAPFKYGGNVHLVGYVTNTTHLNEKSTFFSGPIDMINGMLETMSLRQRPRIIRTAFPNHADNVLTLSGQEHCPRVTS